MNPFGVFRRLAPCVPSAAGCLLIASLAAAAPAPRGPARIVYVSPQPHARLVRPQTGLIVRFDRALDPAEANAAFTVTGSRSGVHAGDSRLADDGRTLVFRPAQPFAWGERVHVAIPAPDGPPTEMEDSAGRASAGAGLEPGLPRTITRAGPSGPLWWAAAPATLVACVQAAGVSP